MFIALGIGVDACKPKIRTRFLSSLENNGHGLWFRQYGWPELSLGSRISCSQTKFGIVFHAEGLVNNRIVGELIRLGQELHDVRPILTVISPMCPMYLIDPLENPIRLELPVKELTTSVERDFKDKIQALSSYYDIGYHGHFFSRTDDRYRPTFNQATIASQFDQEYRFLVEAGSNPLAYAGGWWYMAPHLASLMQSHGIRLDTTINDIRRDSFGRTQSYAKTPLGQPFLLERDIIEIPTIRSDSNLFRLITSDHSLQRYAIFSLHDYNLLTSSFNAAFAKILMKLMKHDRIVGIRELLSVRPSAGVS